jgi:2-polyprenyl-6-methoxyphenol hydroxylase-like FAD-dependent oxidoreductase
MSSAVTFEPERVVVVGGGIGGLGAALALARDGPPVTLLERDPLPVAPDADSAFAAERRDAPQVHQTHGFLARIVVTLRERFPDVLDDLLAAGCFTMPTTMSLGDPQAGDEDLAVLIVRRTTFEWVLRQAALRESGVDVRTGAGVVGLTGTGRTVTGVRLDDGTTLDADAVVVATGRRSGLPVWLRDDLGVEVPETIHESGLMYLSRWYHLPAGFEIGLDPKLGGDLRFVKYLAVPGDGGTLSVTLAIPADDAELRHTLSDPDRFEHACRLLPGPDRFFGDGAVATTGRLEPIGGVRPMGGLVNRIRRFVDTATGEPTVLGVHAVGDAHTCTNPLYGRGCSLALAQAVALADAFRSHPGDARARAVAYETFNTRQIEPWFDVSVQMDAVGADPTGFAGATSDAAKGLAAVLVAAQTDPVIGRAMVRFWNLLATPADLMADAEVVSRIAAVMANPDAYPVPPHEGPTREELLAAIAPEKEEVA